MDDPYRSGLQTGTCPRCSQTTESDGDRQVCTAGCGEWYPKQTFADEWTSIISPPVGQRWGTQTTPWPWSPALCPVCRAEMTIGHRNEVRFDFCAHHGVWLDAGEVQRFTQTLRRS